MGLFDKAKEMLQERKEAATKEKAFQGMVKEKVEVARRQAYSAEAVKKAQEDARVEARKPRLSGFAKVLGGITQAQDAMFPRAKQQAAAIKIKARPKKIVEEKNIFNTKMY